MSDDFRGRSPGERRSPRPNPRPAPRPRRPDPAPAAASPRAANEPRRAPVAAPVPARPASASRAQGPSERPRKQGGELAADPRSFTVPAPGAASIDLRDRPAREGAKAADDAGARILPPPGRARTPVVPVPDPREAPDAPGGPGGPGGPDLPGDPLLPDGAPPEARARRRRRLRWKRIVAVVLLVVFALVAFTGWYAYRTYQKLERIEVGAVLSPGSPGGTNYLIVGTDTREGLDADIGNADVVFGEGVSGTRSDTVMLLRLTDEGNFMLPIPRDLYVPIAGTENTNRINTAIQGGPERLIQTIQQSLGLPVHHYVEIDFAGFLELVDAIGGVEIEFDAPAFDDHSGLVIEEAGLQELDKDQALAYVRSRYYTRIVDGKQVVDGRGDLGRIERQQTFLRAVMSQAGSARNPFTVARVGNAVASNLKVDETIGFFDSIRLARKLSGLNPETVELPTTPTRTKGGAAVLLLEEPQAEEALARFRG